MKRIMRCATAFLLLLALSLEVTGCGNGAPDHQEKEQTAEHQEVTKKEKSVKKKAAEESKQEKTMPSRPETAAEAETAAKEEQTQEETLNPFLSPEGYILPNSSDDYVCWNDLADLNRNEIRLARNEIYARHGRKFDSPELKEYFEGKDWYVGTIDAEKFSESQLNAVENINISYLMDCEQEPGLDGKTPKSTNLYKIIKKFGFRGEKPELGEESVLEFEFYPESIVDCGDYYQIDVTLMQNIYINADEFESARNGDMLTAWKDDLAGTWEMVEKVESQWDDIEVIRTGSGSLLNVGNVTEDGKRNLWMTEDGGTSYLNNICGGKLYIRKDARHRAFPHENYEMFQMEEAYGYYTNVYFDSQGYVTVMELMAS